MINLILAKERNISEHNIRKIEVAHEAIDALFSTPLHNPTKEDIERLNTMLEGLEFYLQYLWGFDLDPTYHTYKWKHPSCTCPTLDNLERLGTPYHIISQDCPLHQEQDRI
jgi:hypothetical protein